MNFDETKHPRDSGGKFTDKNGNSRSDEVKKKAAWVRENGKELPLNNDGSLDEFALRKMYDERATEADDDTPEYGSQEDLNKLLGEEFKGYKGQAAIEKLLKEKRGHVKGAFHRDDIGDIDIFWGNSRVGLQHAIEERLKEKNGINHANEMLENLAESIMQGVFNKRNHNGNFEFIYQKNGVQYWTIIAPEYHNNKLTYLVSAFRRGKQKNKETP